MIQSIDPYLYTVKTFDSLTEQYTLALQTSGPINYNVANQINEYLSPESKQFLSFVEKTKYQIFHILEKVSPVSLTVSGRKKGFVSFCKKLEDISPSLIKDTYALRVIVSSNLLGDPVATNFCYMATKILYDHFQALGWKVDPLKTKKGETIPDEIRSSIYIPNEIPTFVKEYLPLCKDYIAFPKSKGYQGIHLSFIDVKTGNLIEIQVRTSSMHQYAENGPASHKLVYKPNDIVYENIHISGFSYDTNQKKITEDIHGLIIPHAIGNDCILERSNDPIDWL